MSAYGRTETHTLGRHYQYNLSVPRTEAAIQAYVIGA